MAATGPSRLRDDGPSGLGGLGNVAFGPLLLFQPQEIQTLIGVHDSLDDQPRRRVYREYVANGELPAGYATEDGFGLHYIGTELHEAVAMRDGAQA